MTDEEERLVELLDELNTLLLKLARDQRQPTVGVEVTYSPIVNVQLRKPYWWTDGIRLRDELV